MKVIESYTRKYEKNRAFFEQLSGLTHDILEKEIFNRGIKAIVTTRTKRTDSLRVKLYKRNEKKQYKSESDIDKDIVDLVGVRIALYFPSDRKVVNQVIEELFDIHEKKEFPTDPQRPKLNKRFSGYWATHYRAQIKKHAGVSVEFTSRMIEIQVASVLMHAWSEVEHDLVYKPLLGHISEDELSILDEINGLVMAGEIALERLQKAYIERTRKKKELTDRYELSMLVLNNLKKFDITTADLGDTTLLNNYLDVVSKMNTEDVLNSFDNLNSNFSETVMDQILMSIISKDYDNNLRKYLSSFTTDKSKALAYEKFIKTWLLFDKVALELNKQKTKNRVEDTPPGFLLPNQIHDFDEDEVESLKNLRVLRNKILHGYHSVSVEKMNTSTEMLKTIILKMISRLDDAEKRNQLKKEING